MDTELTKIEPFETLLIGLMEKRSDSESVYLLMKQNDPNLFARNIVNFLNHLAQRTNDGDDLVIYINILRRIFSDIFNHSFIEIDVKIVALKAMVDLIICVGSCSKDRDKFQNLLPSIMNMVTESLEKKLEAAAQFELEILIKLAKNEPRFFKTQLVDVINTMFEIVDCESNDNKTKHLAVEFMVTLAEAKQKAPGMVNKYPLFTYKCFAALLKLLEEVDHAEDAWDTLDPVFEKKCIKRLCDAVGGKTMSPEVLEQLFAYLEDDGNSWKKLYAALVALAQILGACSEAIVKNMKQMVLMVQFCIEHSHPGVRSAAVEATGQFSTVLRPLFQEPCHDQLLLALFTAMDDENARVQDRAIFASTTIFWHDMELQLTPYVDQILYKLRELLVQGLKHKGYTEIQEHSIQESAISLLLSIYPKLQDKFPIDIQVFKPYYKTAGVRRLEIVTIMLHNGKSGDLEQVMEVLTSSPQSGEEDDPTTLMQLGMLGELCKDSPTILPFMSIVMPFLFQYAQLEPDVTILSADSNILYSGDNSIQKTKRGDETICIKRVLVYQKLAACDALGNLADKLKEDFYPWISQTASILVPVFKSYFVLSVKRSAVKAMVCLLRSAKLSDEKGIAECGDKLSFIQLSDIIILNLLEVLNEEPEPMICSLMLEGLAECLQIIGPLINEGQIRKIMDGIKLVISESSNRKRNFIESAKTGDFYAELLRDEKEQEDRIFRIIEPILLALIKILNVAFLPFFDELLPYLIPDHQWAKDKTAQERSTPLYIFAVLVHECREAVHRYCDVFLPILLDASNDEQPIVRQNALYGLLLYGTLDGAVFNPNFVRDVISKINVVIMHFGVREIENEGAYINAVATLRMIFEFHWEKIDPAQIISIWLNCLPVKRCLDYLCLIAERVVRKLICLNHQHLSKILSIFAEALCFGENFVVEETTNRIIYVLRHLQQTLPPATLELALSHLLPQHVMELKSILSPEEDFTDGKQAHVKEKAKSKRKKSQRKKSQRKKEEKDKM